MEPTGFEERADLAISLLQPESLETEGLSSSEASPTETGLRWRQDRKQAELIACGLGRRYHNMTLDAVDAKARPAVAGYLERLAHHVGAGRGLLLSGTTGAGKSAILGLIGERAYVLEAERRVGAGRWAEDLPAFRFVYSYDLYAAFFSKDEKAAEKLRKWRFCQLLLLDEFGAAYAHDFPRSQFEGMMEHRQSNKLATCITTNLSLKALRESPEWGRVYDRWRSTCWAIELTGKSKRESLAGEP